MHKLVTILIDVEAFLALILFLRLSLNNILVKMIIMILAIPSKATSSKAFQKDNQELEGSKVKEIPQCQLKIIFYKGKKNSYKVLNNCFMNVFKCDFFGESFLPPHSA